jgi:hypothetical protein
MTLILPDEMCAAYATRPARGNGKGTFAIARLDLIVATPHLCRKGMPASHRLAGAPLLHFRQDPAARNREGEGEGEAKQEKHQVDNIGAACTGVMIAPFTITLIGPAVAAPWVVSPA